MTFNLQTDSEDLSALLLPRLGVFLLLQDQIVVLVGKTKHLAIEVLRHAESHGAGRKVFNKVRFISTATEAEALVLRRALIANYKPLYNLNLTSYKPGLTYGPLPPNPA